MSTSNTSPSTSTTGGGCPFHRGEDDTLSLLRLGYRFLPTLREERTGADDDRPFRFGLLGRRAHALRGSGAVPTFYDPELIERHGAMPTPIQGSLFGKGSVHSLDGEPHLARKELFVAVCYEQEQVDRIKPLVEAEVREAVARWAKYPETVYDAMVIAYGRASLRWAGIEGPDSELDVQAKRLGDIVEGFGHVNLDHARAWVDRYRTDAWFARFIREQRSGRRTAAPGTALHEWAAYREPDGTLLDPRTAGLELQNCIRPHVAVARFAAFAAKDLVENPEWLERVREETASRGGALTDGPVAQAVAQEVRRLSPFVPMLPAFARTDFEVDGEQIVAGDRVVLDVLGTNTDPTAWSAPEVFDPERFLGTSKAEAEANASFIPQGGADVHTGHRCPGERIVVDSLTTTVAALCLPEVELSRAGLDVDLETMPTMPRSGAVVRTRREGVPASA